MKAPASLKRLAGALLLAWSGLAIATVGLLTHFGTIGSDRTGYFQSDKRASLCNQSATTRLRKQ